MPHASKKILLFLVMFFAIFSYAKEDYEEILQQINYLSWSVNKITTTRSPLVLEEVYEEISDNGLRLDNIKDGRIKDICIDIMDEITDLRLDEMERKFWTEIRDMDKKHAIWAAFPNPSLIVSADWKAVAMNIATSVISGIFHYQALKYQIEREYKIKMHELDMSRIESLNNLNTALLNTFWSIVGDKQIPDLKRTTRTDCKELAETLKLVAEQENSVGQGSKSTNDSLIYDFLCNNQKRYTYLAQYWYFRGVFAEKTGNIDDAIASYRFYLEHYHQILRKDITAARVVLHLLYLARGNSKLLKKGEKQKLCEFMSQNLQSSDWDLNLTCGLYYLEELSEEKNAALVLEKAVNYLEIDYAKRYSEFIQNLEEDDEIKIKNTQFPTCKELSICRNALLRAYAKYPNTAKIRSTYIEYAKRNSAIAVDLFQIFSPSRQGLQLPSELIAELLLTEVVRDDSDDYIVSLPLSWFIIDDCMNDPKPKGPSVKMIFFNSNNEILEETSEYKAFKNRYVYSLLWHSDSNYVNEFYKHLSTISDIYSKIAVFGRSGDIASSYFYKYLAYYGMEATADKSKELPNDAHKLMLHLEFNTDLSYKKLKKQGLDHIDVQVSWGNFVIHLRVLPFPESQYPLENTDETTHPATFALGEIHKTNSVYVPIISSLENEPDIGNILRDFYLGL